MSLPFEVDVKVAGELLNELLEVGLPRVAHHKGWMPDMLWAGDVEQAASAEHTRTRRPELVTCSSLEKSVDCNRLG